MLIRVICPMVEGIVELLKREVCSCVVFFLIRSIIPITVHFASNHKVSSYKIALLFSNV